MLLFTIPAWKSIGKYRLELGVADDTAHVVVVLFDEPATELLKCSAESLMASFDEVSLYLLFNYFHRFQTNLYLQSADEDSNLLVAITNLIGTTHIFELKSHTYYEYGTFESFTYWKINPACTMEEVASSTTVDENTNNHSPEFKSLAQTPSLSTPSKGPEEKKKKRSGVEESDADDDCGSSKQPPECNADAGTRKKKQKSHLFVYVTDPQNDPMVTPSLSTMLNNYVLIQSNTTIRHDGRVQSYCGLSVKDIDVLCSGPNPAILPLSDRNTINVDQTAGPSTSRYASTRLRRRSTDYAPCGATDGWLLWALSSVGLGPVAYCMVWARVPDGAIRHHILPVTGTIVFFWIDASVCPLSISWFSGVSVVKDPLMVDEAVDLPCVELLNENRTIIRKYPEVFLCLLGLSRSFTETDIYPTLLHNNDEEMGLLDFVNSADPFKVKIGEQPLAENKVPLLTETKDSVISPSPQTISLVDHTIQDKLNVNVDKRKKRVAFVSELSPMKRARTEGIVISNSRPSTTGKSPTALRRLIRQSGQADTGSGTAAPVTEDATFSSVTPTLERAPEDDFSDNVVPLVSSAQAGVNVHVTEPASDALDSSAPELEARALSATPSQGSSADDFYESQTIDSATALNVFNINSAQHVCLVSELRVRYEHKIMTREKYDKKFTNSVAIVQQRNAKIVDLKTRLEKSEDEAAKVVELLKHVSDLEVVVAVKASEVATLNTHNAGLLKKVFTLELVHGELDSKVSQMTADCDGLRDQVVGEDVIRDMDDDLYPHMLTAIAGRRWVVRHDFCFVVHKCALHGKAGRSLTQIEAYDPKTNGKYVAAVSEFENVSFLLLDELEGLKDSLLALIMYALALKDDHGNTDPTPEFRQFQPSLDQGFGSAPPRDSSLGVADYQVSTLVLFGDRGSANQPPVMQPHDDLFDTSVLGGSSGP
ncbi:hypothetical protein Tco_0205839 [Tanacetum coccineum]